MSIIICDFQKFNSGNVLSIKNGNNNINVSEDFFIWSFITLGKNKKSKIRLEEILHKYFFIRFCVNFNKHIEINQFVVNLDPTEKKYIAYNLGMAVTRIISYTFFQHNRLYYVSSKKYKTGKGTYDLVSQNKYGYSLFESKGSTNSGQGKNKAISQVKGPNYVNNQIPIYSVAVIQGFDNHNRMTAQVIDPIPDNQNGINIDNEQDDAYLVRILIKEAFERHDVRSKIVDNTRVNYIVLMNIELGLIDESIYDFNNHESKDYFIGRDGVYVSKIKSNLGGQNE